MDVEKDTVHLLMRASATKTRHEMRKLILKLAETDDRYKKKENIKFKIGPKTVHTVQYEYENNPYHTHSTPCTLVGLFT
jgi:hypothetical protein